MRYLLLLLLSFCCIGSPAAAAAPLADVSHSPACLHCGMDREKFGQSRMLIEYEDGSKVATCSLHCTAVELANSIDKIPASIKVADFDSKELIDAERAIWTLGGSKKGVMTANAKWAFASEAGATRFIKANGGSIVPFEEAIKAAYQDMYQDTRMIRELRKMKRLKHQGSAPAH